MPRRPSACSTNDSSCTPKTSISAPRSGRVGIAFCSRQPWKSCTCEADFVVLCRAEDAEALASLGENFRAVIERAGNYSIAEQVRIPLALRREGVTLFHAPHYVLPPLVRCPSVVTIHDCIHLMFPQYLPNRFAFGYARTSIGLAARRATRVLTVSESSKRDILRFVDTEPDKIDVIYNAYDERFGVEPREEEVVRVRERFQLPDG